MKLQQVFFFFAAAFVLQPATQLVAFHGIGPDLLLCSVIFLLPSQQERGGALTLSVLFALIRDICWSLYTGPGAVAMLLAGWVACLAAKYCTWDRVPFLLAFTAVETFLYQSCLWAMENLLGAPWHFFHMLKVQPLCILYNMGIVMLLSVVLNKLRK